MGSKVTLKTLDKMVMEVFEKGELSPAQLIDLLSIIQAMIKKMDKLEKRR